MITQRSVRPWYLAMTVVLVFGVVTLGGAPVYAQTGSVTASALPSDANPEVGDTITVPVIIDVSNVDEENDQLGSFTASLNWNTSVLSYVSNSGILAGFTGVINTEDVASGQIIFNGANASGATGAVQVLEITFDVVGNGSSALDLEFSAMAAANTFNSLLPILTVTDGQVQVGDIPESPITYLGDIGSATSTTSSSTLVITTDTSVAVGDTIIVAFATYGDPDYTISVADSAGNTYTEAASATTYQHGRTYIFFSKLTTALPSGGTITITHTAVDGATVAVASAFRGLLDNPLDQSLGNPVTGAEQTISGTEPTVGPTGTTVQADELLIGSIGTEGPMGDSAGTWQNSFTAGPRLGTTGGTATDNWTVSMGYRIVSSTGQYTAAKNGITDRYWAAAIATFKGGPAGPSHDLTMAVAPTGGGTTDPAVGMHIYAENAVVTITAEPASGYEFDYWEGDVADPNSATTTVTMDEDQAVTAHFIETPAGPITYLGDIGSATSTTSSSTLVITTDTAAAAGNGIIVAFATYGDPDYEISVADSAGNTYIEAASATTYQHGRTYIFFSKLVNALPSGGTITITHTAVDGVTVAVASAFSGLADDPLDQSLGNPVTGAEQTLSGTEPTVGPTGTTIQPHELLIGSIGTEGPMGDSAGTWQNSFIAGPRLGTTGGTATDNWTVSMGYRIVSATGEYTAEKTGITDRYWAAAIATFKGGAPVVTYDLTMAVDPTGGGTTTPAVGVHTYDEDELVNIEATPASGYEFDYWDGDVDDPNSASTTVTMDDDMTVTAHFSLVTYDLTMAVEPDGGGTTTPAAGVYTYDEDEVVNITAEAAEGFEFDYWDGDVDDLYSASTTVTMDGDKTVTAHFLDIVPPDTGITSYPVNPNSSADATFTFISNEGGSTFECQLDDSGFIVCDSPQEYTGLSDGEHTFQVRAVDGAGNPDPTPAEHTWTIDTLAPDTIITTQPANPSNSTDAAFEFTSTETGSTFECQLDSGGYAVCDSPQEYSGLAEGEHTFQVRATDGVGNLDLTPAEHIWTIDTLAPETNLTAYPDDPSNSADASFGFSSDDPGATFECQLDGVGFSACSSPEAYSGLADGGHTFQVRAVDEAGNPDLSPAGHGWTIDTHAPDTNLTGYPDDPSYDVDASFSFESDDPGATFECSLDGASFSACSSPQNYTGLTEGEHTFDVRAVDWVGNPDQTPAGHEWTIDLIAPAIELTKTADPTIVNVGDEVDFTLQVENTGDSDLDEITVEDDLDGCILDGPTGDNGDGILQEGEIWTYTCTIVAGTLDIDNTATVEARDLAGGLVDDEASAHVDVIHPAISLNKMADPKFVDVGDLVTFKLEVSNAGDSVLSNVIVEDHLTGCVLSGPSGDDGDAILQTEEMWTYTCSLVAGTVDIENTATVEAEDIAGGTVQDEDETGVNVLHAGIQIEKTPDLQNILPGETAIFNITVRNTGDAGLENVSVTDEQTPDCERLIGTLDVGASVSYSCQIANVTVNFTNLARVNGKPASDTLVTDNDTAGVIVLQPGAPPEINSTPVLEAIIGQPYTYTVSTNFSSSISNLEANGVEDATSGQVTITADVLPAWLNLDDHGDGTALLTGVPLVADVYPVQLRAEDAFGQSDTQKFNITVDVAPAPEVEHKSYLPQILK